MSARAWVARRHWRDRYTEASWREHQHCQAKRAARFRLAERARERRQWVANEALIVCADWDFQPWDRVVVRDTASFYWSPLRPLARLRYPGLSRNRETP